MTRPFVTSVTSEKIVNLRGSKTSESVRGRQRREWGSGRFASGVAGEDSWDAFAPCATVSLEASGTERSEEMWVTVRSRFPGVRRWFRPLAALYLQKCLGPREM